MSHIKTSTLGFPRIGDHRELKFAEEKYWRNEITLDELKDVSENIKKINWKRQKDAGIDSFASNDFSFYDQVLDAICLTGAIPKRFGFSGESVDPETYFLMARGINKTTETHALEMTKWFDTNYHYLVPEFTKDQTFSLSDDKIFDEYVQAKEQGIETVPVLLGPLSFLHVGKEKEEGFSRLELLPKLLPVYEEILKKFSEKGAKTVRIDEPILSFDLEKKWSDAYQKTYTELAKANINIIFANYFGSVGENLSDILSLPVGGFHFDFTRGAKDIPFLLENFPAGKTLSAGVIDGRNIWRNDYKKSLKILLPLKEKVGSENIYISGSCSFQFVPISLAPEKKLDSEIKSWLSFAEEKLQEIVELSEILADDSPEKNTLFLENQKKITAQKTSSKTNNPAVRERVAQISDQDASRKSPFAERQKKQQAIWNLPAFPTTTIGSFPQTKEIREARKKLRTKEWDIKEYEAFVEQETKKLIQLQEEIGLDVLVHGEFERNDMVQYFGELLEGFVFTENAWVQSYGSRCLKPPVIYGDISRPNPMTIRWSAFAQGLTKSPVKGMLTGPVTILQWSFVRQDISREDTTYQIALALRDEVQDLEKAGIGIIQIDEPALREGLPLRREDWEEYLEWSTKAFRLSCSGVQDETQIHTHMCYAEFNDIIEAISLLDADVISIENSRSDAELLRIFHDFKYANEIGPGVWDIHSPRIPSTEEMVNILKSATSVLDSHNLWVNPDCGLKTRQWPETITSLTNMVEAAKILRKQ